MSRRQVAAVELAGAVIVSLGAGLIYLPAGLIVFGLLLILSMQGIRPRERQ